MQRAFPPRHILLRSFLFSAVALQFPAQIQLDYQRRRQQEPATARAVPGGHVGPLDDSARLGLSSARTGSAAQRRLFRLCCRTG